MKAAVRSYFKDPRLGSPKLPRYCAASRMIYRKAVS